MSDPVIIGIKEVYDAVQKLDGRMDDFILKQELLQQRVAYLEQAGTRKWQTNLALYTSAAAILSSFLVPLVIK